MFSSFKSGSNPYDANVDKATDEALPSEPWDVFITICDKVDLEGETGARNVIQSLQRRLTHRSANVQLFALTLADALVNNCKAPLHREIASSSFMESLKRLATDRTSHEKVKRRTFLLLKKWSGEFARDERLGLVEEAYQSLLGKGMRYEEESTQPQAARSNENDLRRKEEEDIQRAIRESELEAERAQARYSTGYQPAPQASTSQPQPTTSSQNHYPNIDKPLPSNSTDSIPASLQPASNSRQNTLSANQISRAKALYDFDPDPNQPGELPLRKGDILRILDKPYAEWWKGELRGRVGIFPCNWVEVLPDLSEDQLIAEARVEAGVFGQVANVDRLLELLRRADATPNPMAAISDDDEITELYQQCLSLRPKVVKLIDKYASRREELLDINTKFVEAKRAYEMMLDESWARHNAAQQQQSQQQSMPSQMIQPSYGQPQMQGPPMAAPNTSQQPMQQGYYYPQNQGNQPGMHQFPSNPNLQQQQAQGLPQMNPSHPSEPNMAPPIQAPQISISSPPPAEALPAQQMMPPTSQSFYQPSNPWSSTSPGVQPQDGPVQQLTNNVSGMQLQDQSAQYGHQHQQGYTMTAQ